MADRTWKAVERRAAALFGVKRIPPAVYGQRDDRGDDAPDFETDTLAAQVKHGYKPPAYIKDWLTGINKTAGPHRTGFLLWHAKGARIEDSYVILRLRDFLPLVGAAPLPAPPASAPPPTPDDTPPAPG